MHVSTLLDKYIFQIEQIQNWRNHKIRNIFWALTISPFPSAFSVGGHLGWAEENHPSSPCKVFFFPLLTLFFLAIRKKHLPYPWRLNLWLIKFLLDKSLLTVTILAIASCFYGTITCLKIFVFWKSFLCENLCTWIQKSWSCRRRSCRLSRSFHQSLCRSPK